MHSHQYQGPREATISKIHPYIISLHLCGAWGARCALELRTVNMNTDFFFPKEPLVDKGFITFLFARIPMRNIEIAPFLLKT